MAAPAVEFLQYFQRTEKGFFIKRILPLRHSCSPSLCADMPKAGGFASNGAFAHKARPSLEEPVSQDLKRSRKIESSGLV